MSYKEFENFCKQSAGAAPPLSLRLIWLLDTSYSVAYKDKLKNLNNAICELHQSLHIFQKKNSRVRTSVQAITFSDDAQWHIRWPISIEALRWNNIKNAPGLVSDMGKALKLLKEDLERFDFNEVPLTLVIVMVSNGRPADDWITGLKQFFDHSLARRALRFAVYIGTQEDNYVLDRFVRGVNYLSFLDIQNQSDLLVLKVYTFFSRALNTLSFKIFQQNEMWSSGTGELSVKVFVIEPEDQSLKAKIASFHDLSLPEKRDESEDNDNIIIFNGGNIITFEGSKKKVS
jgi:uncharacterized protein YegL